MKSTKDIIVLVVVLAIAFLVYNRVMDIRKIVVTVNPEQPSTQSIQPIPTLPTVQPVQPAVMPTWTPFYQVPTNVPVVLPEPTQILAEPVKQGLEGGGTVGNHDPGRTDHRTP